MFLVVVTALAGCHQAPPETAGSNSAIDAFVNTHWQDPLPPQGSPPAVFSGYEPSLAAAACGACHTNQLQDWRTSLHSGTMGPGISWQFEKLGATESNQCLKCHAPLAEQKALLAADMGWSTAPKSPPPAYVGADLHREGLQCAGCHVRKHVRYGPPARVAQSAPAAPAAHGGFIAATAFEDSRFCTPCHQFPENGPRLAGKLREDTYAQWQASSYASKETCQTCHMPDRRHLWRGIHDPDMVRKALAIDLRLEAVGSDRYRVIATAQNRGAGHHLPTYLVPKINLEFLFVAKGQPARVIGRDVIGWRADVQMTEEMFDTRIPAGASRKFEHEFPAPRRGDWRVVLRVEVDPAEHYIRSFRYSQANVELSKSGRETLARAIAEAQAKRYEAMQLSIHP